MSIAQQNQIHALELAITVLEVRVTNLERRHEESLDIANEVIKETSAQMIEMEKRLKNKNGRIVMKNGHAEISAK